MTARTWVFMLARFIPAGLTLFTLYLYTNSVNPVEYGRYTNIISFASLIYPIIFGPIWYFIIRFRMENSDEVDQKCGVVSYFAVVTILILNCIIFLISLNSSLKELYTVGLMVLLFGIFQISIEQKRAVDQPSRYLFLAATRSILILLISWLFISYDFSFLYNSIVDATIVGIGIAIAPNMVGLLRYYNLRKLQVTLREIYGYGIFFALGLTVNTGLFSADRLMIYYLSGASEAGLYSSPYDLAMKLIYTIVFALELSMLPALLKASKAGLDLAEQFTLNIKTYLFIVLPIVVVLLALSSEICKLYFSQDYYEAGKEIFPVILVATFIIGFAHAIFYHAYILNNKGKLYFLTISSVFLLNIILNLISNLMGHPFFSSWIAIGTSIIYAFITYFHASTMHRFYFPTLFFIKVLLLCSPIFLLYFYNPIINIFYLIAFKMIFAVVFYIGAVFIFNVFDGRARIHKIFNALKIALKI